MTYCIDHFTEPGDELRPPHEALADYLNTRARDGWRVVQYRWQPGPRRVERVAGSPAEVGNPDLFSALVTLQEPDVCEILLARDE